MVRERSPDRKINERTTYSFYNCLTNVKKKPYLEKNLLKFYLQKIIFNLKKHINPHDVTSKLNSELNYKGGVGSSCKFEDKNVNIS